MAKFRQADVDHRYREQVYSFHMYETADVLPLIKRLLFQFAEFKMVLITRKPWSKLGSSLSHQVTVSMVEIVTN